MRHSVNARVHTGTYRFVRVRHADQKADESCGSARETRARGGESSVQVVGESFSHLIHPLGSELRHVPSSVRPTSAAHQGCRQEPNRPRAERWYRGHLAYRRGA